MSIRSKKTQMNFTKTENSFLTGTEKETDRGTADKNCAAEQVLWAVVLLFAGVVWNIGIYLVWEIVQ